jgi:hypothetical protein
VSGLVSGLVSGWRAFSSVSLCKSIILEALPQAQTRSVIIVLASVLDSSSKLGHRGTSYMFLQLQIDPETVDKYFRVHLPFRMVLIKAQSTEYMHLRQRHEPMATSPVVALAHTKPPLDTHATQVQDTQKSAQRKTFALNLATLPCARHHLASKLTFASDLDAPT